MQVDDILRCIAGYMDDGFHLRILHSIEDGACTCGSPECGSPGKHPWHLWSDVVTPDDFVALVETWNEYPNLNVGIATGRVSGIVVLDVDPRHNGHASLTALECEHGPLPRTRRFETGGGGFHLIFRCPAGELRNSAGRVGEGLDIRADGGYIVAPPSLHASGARYSEVGEDRTIAEMPEWLYKLATSSACKQRRAEPIAAEIPVGRRNDVLISLAGSMRRRGLTPGEILPTLSMVNQKRCTVPLSDAELTRIADSIGRYEPGELVRDDALSVGILPRKGVLNVG